MRQMLAMQIWRADFNRLHAQFARQEARQRHFKLRIGEEENAFAIKRRAMIGQCSAGAFAAWCGGLRKAFFTHAPNLGRGAQPCGCAFFAQGKGCRDMPCATRFQGARGASQERLREQKTRTFANRRQFRCAARWQEAHRPHAKCREKPNELVFHHFRQRAHHQQGTRCARFGRHFRHQSGKAGILTFGEGGFNTATRITQYAHTW